MENNDLNNLWESQNNDLDLTMSEDIIRKAKNQRKGQYLTIIILAITIAVLISYTLYMSLNQWNNFAFGLVLMISSLLLRVALELVTVYRKDSQLTSMSYKSYKNYLKTYYKLRLWINYFITPICIAIYSYGFYLLLPYFKSYFSEGFYTYILISGIGSIAVICVIIVRSIIKEQRYLRQLKQS